MANDPMTRKEFYLAKMAGEDVNVPVPQTREETYLKKIAENGGSGSALPAVTTDDNGSVLTVVEGAWDKAVPSGGSKLVVNMTYDENEVFTADKTAKQIADAFPNVVFKLTESEGGATVDNYTIAKTYGEFTGMYQFEMASNLIPTLYAASPDAYLTSEEPQPTEPTV